MFATVISRPKVCSNSERLARRPPEEVSKLQDTTKSVALKKHSGAIRSLLMRQCLASDGHLHTLAHSWRPVLAGSSRSPSDTVGSPFQCTPSRARLNEADRGRQADR